jgi:fimbrial chaperone protein
VKNTIRSIKSSATFLLALMACACMPAWGGTFSVNPISLELGVTAKSGVLVVKNEGADKIGFQIEAKEWTQDAEGKDQYIDTQDLIFFPKILSVSPDNESVIRVGLKSPAILTEKTYRLFIAELPGAAPATADAKSGSGAQVSILIRFGAPIFVAPIKPQDSAEIPSIAVSKSAITLAVKNTGNRHQVIEGIELRGVDSLGADVYVLTLADRYLLNGTTKVYKSMIPADQCLKLKSLTVELKTDKAGAKRTIDVNRSMCS